MSHALVDHEGSVRFGARTITDVHFADNIDEMTGKDKLVKCVDSLGQTSTYYGMEIREEKTKIMTIYKDGTR